MKNGNYYLGLDIGTDSVGYAVTDEQYNLKKFHGEPAWGVHVFEPASLNAERRSFRTARRRLDRRQQRVLLLQELFAKEIEKADKRFFVRLQESYLLKDETESKNSFFNDSNYSDEDYYNEFPTIHHLICDLMENPKPHDVRLVYLALAWLVAHRGHFLSNIDKSNIERIKDFSTAYNQFLSYFSDYGYAAPWQCEDTKEIEEVLKKKQGVNAKYKDLVKVLLNGEKPRKEGSEEFPYSLEALIKLLAGGTVKLKDLYCNDDYEEAGSVSLGFDDDKLGEIMAGIGDDYDLIAAARILYDWALLVDSIGNASTISEAKVNIFDQHKKDLSDLKYIVRKYVPAKYNEVFRKKDKKLGNYVSYSYHTNDGDTSNVKKVSKEDFSKYILGILKDVNPEESDLELFEDIVTRLNLCTFLPKQKNTDNRVIPHQLYWYELKRILNKAEQYLPFLLEKDTDGLTISEKIESIFLFKIPYFVGPLNLKSRYAWLERKAGRIYPWNFDNMVDLDASEQRFIQRMTNTCTYIPGEPVLPKDSLCYHRFLVLNEINNLKINGQSIEVELKQDIYTNLFLKNKKVTRKKLIEYLICNGVIKKDETDTVSGIDIEIKSNLTPQIAFRKLLQSHVLSERDAERIIERSSYAEDKTRLSKWIDQNYPKISPEDKKYLCGLKFRDFGRLSYRFLCELEGASCETGEVTTILSAMWNTNCNLMELLSDKYTFKHELERISEEYYSAKKLSLDDRLNDMYLSNTVRRPVYRTLDIIKDVQKAFGKPAKIFVEMTRGSRPEQKGKRTSSRKQQILELYAKCKDEEVRQLKQQLEEMGEYCDNKLQGDKLFLYYMQLGKCMYSEKSIDLNRLGSKEYDIDHIYPQSLVKDDSIINNRVLVLSSENGNKSDNYPIEERIRHKRRGYWEHLKNVGLISEEKFKRLVRSTPFTSEEKFGFINRQLTETSQSTKAIASLLKEKFPEADIVYCKAGLVSDFRQQFDIYKSRSYNDLHHAVDAYLNIVTGNVYHMRFSKRWFSIDSKYSIKTTTLFSHPVVCGSETVWTGQDMIAKVKKIAAKNNAHFTKYSYFKKGGLFDQMPVPKGEGLVPLKKGRPTNQYGGYNKAGAMFYIPVRYKAGKKSEIIIMSVEMLCGEQFLKNDDFAKEYSFVRLKHILGKKVDEVSFPMGMRPWKVNTVLSLDGFRVCIAGIGSGGKCLVAQPIVQFSSDYYWQYYLKKIESFTEKCKKNPNYIYDEDYDKISCKMNMRLYSIYIDKIKNSIYSKRVNAPTDILAKGEDSFAKLGIKEQAQAILNIHQVFGRVSGGCDLSLVGGAKKAAATVNFSATVSNWKKTYSDVRIIDVSTSGLWEKKSDNLLELL